jgi:hypothetical protein
MEIDDARRAIADRALDELGTPFRLFGQTSKVGLDCVGLALIALGPLLPGRMVTRPYHLRGEQLETVRKSLAGTVLVELDCPDERLPGDLALVSPSPSQLHFMIAALDGWVHADAALRRVVLRPGPLPWQLRSLWRLGRI